MKCFACEDGWLRRSVPHPCLPGKRVIVTRVCPTCEGKGKVEAIPNLFAAVKEETYAPNHA
jgi:hypothetical protein